MNTAFAFAVCFEVVSFMSFACYLKVRIDTSNLISSCWKSHKVGAILPVRGPRRGWDLHLQFDPGVWRSFFFRICLSKDNCASSSIVTAHSEAREPPFQWTEAWLRLPGNNWAAGLNCGMLVLCLLEALICQFNPMIRSTNSSEKVFSIVICTVLSWSLAQGLASNTNMLEALIRSSRTSNQRLCLSSNVECTFSRRHTFISSQHWENGISCVFTISVQIFESSLNPAILLSCLCNLLLARWYFDRRRRRLPR